MCTCVCVHVCEGRCAHSTTCQCSCGDQRTTLSVYPHLPPCLRRVLLSTIDYAMLSGFEPLRLLQPPPCCRRLQTHTAACWRFQLGSPTTQQAVYLLSHLLSVSDRVLLYGLPLPRIQCLPATAPVLGSRKTPHPARFLFVLLCFNLGSDLGMKEQVQGAVVSPCSHCCPLL